MLANFEQLKDQIRQLADVVNAFKSEAVQLLVVQLLLSAELSAAEPDEEPKLPAEAAKGKRPRSRSTKAPNADPGGTKAPPKERKAAAGVGKPGGTATLTRLIGDGFFGKPKTIKEIVDHCQTKLALKFTQPAFSGPLIRAVRDGKLKRGKNKDGQFEYSKP